MRARFLHPLFSLLAPVTQQDLARQVAYLKEENRLLRARLPERIMTTERERQRLIKVGRKLGPHLSALISIVTYLTFLRWVRATEEKRDRKSQQSAPTQRTTGRPRTCYDVKELILKIRCETGYGYTRIRHELAKLAIRVSRQTVKNVLVAGGHEPYPESGKDSWDVFLKRHAETLWQCDFMVKPMWTIKGLVDLHTLVLIHIQSRQIWISRCTSSPDTKWVV